MSDPGRNSAPGPLEESYLEGIENLHTLWLNTSNPVYVWRAISLCYVLPSVRARDLSGEYGQLQWDQPAPLPPWCLEYLGVVSARIAELSEGRDFRKQPPPFGDGTEEAARDGKNLDPARAAALVAAALGITRKGGNAFSDARGLFQKGLDALSFETFINQGSSQGLDALSFETFINQGSSRAKALETIANENGYAEIRTVERRLSDYRKAVASCSPGDTDKT